MQLPDGLYDKLVTESLAELIAGLPDPKCRTLATLPAEQASERIANAIGKQLSRLLDDLGGDAEDKAKRQLALVNNLLVHLRTRAPAADLDRLAEPAQILQAVHSGGCPPELPETGLAIPWLFTAGRGSPSLLTELRHELAGCDQADLLV